MEIWLRELSDEDRNFIKRFVIASGSLKALAEQYKVSYPTLRTRLDRLIYKIKSLDDSEGKGPLRIKLRSLAADGMISTAVAKEILTAYEKERRGEEDG